MVTHNVVVTTDYTTVGWVDGDNFNVNASGDFEADINGKAGGNCVVNNDGKYRVAAGVDALFNSGGGFNLTVNEGGRVHGEGTLGNNAVIGGDAVTNMNQIAVGGGGYISADYTTFQYISATPAIRVYEDSKGIFRNCTIQKLNAAGIAFDVLRGAFLEMDTVNFSGYDSCKTVFSAAAAASYLKLRNVTMEVAAAGAWLSGVWSPTVEIIGTCTIDINGAGAVEIDNTNDLGTYVEDFRYYPTLVLSEGNNVANCSPSVKHPQQTNGQLIDSTTKIVYDAYKVFDEGDGSGDVSLYLLEKAYFDGAWKRWSDSDFAAAGDNQKFTLSLSKTGYQWGSTTAWADDGTASITLTALASITISNQLLTDYSITTSEFTTGRCTIVGAPDGVWISIDGKMTSINNIGSGIWEGSVYGRDIGVVANKEVLFIAGTPGGAAIEQTPSNITVTASSVKVNPDPLDTIYQMILSGYDKSFTDNEKPQLKALVDGLDPHEVQGMRGMDFKKDGMYIYELNESEQSKGTGYDHANRIDPVSIDVHVNGTRAHFRKVIDMLKSLLYAERKHPTTYPLNTDYVYDSLYFEGQGNEFSSKYTGHFRIIFTVRLMSFWESIT